MDISVSVSWLGDTKVGVLKFRVGQSVAISDGIRNRCPGDENTTPHPKSKRGLIPIL